MKIQEFQKIFRDSKGREDKRRIIFDYTKLINDIASTQDYPGWFNQISLNMMICGLRNAGFKFNYSDIDFFYKIFMMLSDWLPDYGAQEISNSLLALDQM
jgi:hypothetical protein